MIILERQETWEDRRMAQPTSNSLAATVAAGIKNVQFLSGANVVQRKILIIGTGDPTTEASNPLNTPVLVTSPEDVASKTGFGFMLHRLAIQAQLGAQGIPTYIIQQSETGFTASAGEIDFTGSTGVKAGTLALYIAGISVPVTITDAMTVEEIADAVVAAITANSDLPVTAAKVAVTFEVTITAKSKGLNWGDNISITFNRKSTDETPTGITSAITAMTSGAGTPDIQDALDSLGTGDGANEEFYTDAVHGYGQVTAVLDAIANYIGQGNDYIGCWSKIVHKPFRFIDGNVVAGSGGLSTLIALGDGRKLDRANGIISVPGSKSHPSEIAAQMIGHMAKINNDLAEQNYLGVVLTGIDPGDKSDRWTSEYTSRDSAVKAGIGTTTIKNGVVTVQDVVTFYHPDNVAQTSNGFRSMRNISILQNILDNQAANFEREEWQGISIVADVTKVANVNSRKKTRDITSVISELVALAYSFEDNAWLYSASFTIKELKEAGAVLVRTGGDGFEMTSKYVLSGESNILSLESYFDISIAVFL